jgi:hypothetical protein
MASSTLLSNVSISAPITSAAVQLNGALQYWDATVFFNMPVGTDIDISILASPTKNGTYVEVSRAEFAVGSPTDKFGGDATHFNSVFSLDKSNGTWFKGQVNSVTGTVTIISLTVNNHA